MRGRLVVALVTLLLLSGAVFAAKPSVPSGWAGEGQITYQVLRGEGGIKLGEAVHSWRYDGGRYHMSAVVETTGLAGMLYSFRYVQRSEGEVSNARLRPVSFSVDQRGRDPESASFDWADGTVEIARSRGRKETHQVAAGDQDVLSVWHLVALRGGRDLPSELTLVTNRTAAPATLTVLGKESIRLPIGQIDALRVQIRAKSGRLSIDMWLSEQNQLMPVRVLMEDDKGEVLDQQAIAIEIGATGSAN